jgi:outer membrane protein TolC
VDVVVAEATLQSDRPTEVTLRLSEMTLALALVQALGGRRQVGEPLQVP